MHLVAKFDSSSAPPRWSGTTWSISTPMAVSLRGVSARQSTQKGFRDSQRLRRSTAARPRRRFGAAALGAHAATLCASHRAPPSRTSLPQPGAEQGLAGRPGNAVSRNDKVRRHQSAGGLSRANYATIFSDSATGVQVGPLNLARIASADLSPYMSSSSQLDPSIVLSATFAHSSANQGSEAAQVLRHVDAAHADAVRVHAAFVTQTLDQSLLDHHHNPRSRSFASSISLASLTRNAHASGSSGSRGDHHTATPVQRFRALMCSAIRYG
jgi:hypothetical protein